MFRFIVGDELGHIKTIRYAPNTFNDTQCEIKTIHQQAGTASGASCVQQLATWQGEGQSTILGATFSDGNSVVSTLSGDDKLEIIAEWKEPRLSSGKFIGSAIQATSMFTCTSSGMLRRTQFTNVSESNNTDTHETRTLPSGLGDWRLAEDGESFAYAGDEVDLSVWDTNLAFTTIQKSTPAASELTKKRKRNEELFLGEIWRARNVPNDHLGLRQPIRFTSLTYLESAGGRHNIVAGTQFGDIRRYDTKAGRRPISNWAGIAKVGGVGTIQKGGSEHELFISDKGSNLYSVDLRAGNILYSYKGLSGAVISIAPAQTHLASVALDRYCRVHSTSPPPPTAGSNMEAKGSVLDKTYLTSVPTVIVWDQCTQLEAPATEQVDGDDEEDDIWENMEHIN